MSEGFDYQAHQRALGKDPDKALLVSFEYRAEKLPDATFKNVEYIKIWLGKNDEICRKVTPEDKIRFADRYNSFKAGEEMPESGTPIGECAFSTPADISACKAERIFTLEQLVETSDERLQRARLVNLKYKARDWLESQKRHGYVGELRDQITARDNKIAMLEQRAAEQDQRIAELEASTKRRRSKDGEDSA